MSEPLARVTQEIDVPRGADLQFDISVPTAWMGRTVRIALPRKLKCARCDGGGCDPCDRSGAGTLYAEGAPAETVRVALPQAPPGGQDVLIRLPEQGGAPTDPSHVRGHLLLRVRFAQEPSPCVSLETQAHRDADAQRRELMKRSLYMAVILVATFIGLLKLSGWL